MNENKSRIWKMRKLIPRKKAPFNLKYYYLILTMVWFLIHQNFVLILSTARCFFWGWTGNLGFLWWTKIEKSRKESARKKKIFARALFLKYWSVIVNFHFSVIFLWFFLWFFCNLKSFIWNFERLEKKFFYQNA